jgi:hypothetical protein
MITMNKVFENVAFKDKEPLKSKLIAKWEEEEKM